MAKQRSNYNRFIYRAVFFAAIIGIILAAQLDCVLGYKEMISFDINSTHSLDNCSRVMWYLDLYEGNSSAPSLRSGPIRSSGISCVKRIVEGPAYINFMWKIVNDRIGELSFNVDNESILVCPSSSWSPASYAISSGNHMLSWEYRKLYSYPEFVGAGWIDDLSIVSPRLHGPGTQGSPINLTCGDMNWTVKRDLRQNVSYLEDNIKRINASLDVINRRIDNIELSTWEDRLNLNKSIAEINRTIRIINNMVEDANKPIIENIAGINETLKGITDQINRVDDICRQITNASNNKSESIDLSWISDNVVFISDERSNLTDVVLKSKNKIIILADGIYRVNSLQILQDNTTIRSFRKWGAIIDANNSTEGILLDTVNNVTIDSLVIMNCKNGLHVENSTDCLVVRNIFTDFKEVGVFLKNSSNSTFMLNTVHPMENLRKKGFELNKSSNNNMFLFNKIFIERNDNRSRLYEIDRSSKDNNIYISNDGRIKEGNVTCTINNSKKFNCTNQNDNPMVYEPLSWNCWEFLD